MLRQHSKFFENLLLLGDLVLIVCCWLFGYAFRFYGPLPLYETIPPLGPYLWLLLPVLVIWTFAFKAFGLYKPRRITSRIREIWDVARASSIALLVLIAVTFFYRDFSFSRLVIVVFWLSSTFALCFSRACFREILRFFRRQGYNLRHTLIVGTGPLARKVIEAINAHPELGVRIAGLLGEGPHLVGQRLNGIEVLGSCNEIQRVMAERGVDQVFIALPFDASLQLETVLSGIRDTIADIKWVPDFHRYVTLRGGIEEFENLPFISLQDSPLYGWNSFLKRGLDLLVGGIALVLFSPLMAVIALAIRRGSPGPIFFQQERMGLDGRRFQMLKFRTMINDAEELSAPAWTTPEDPRVTRLGRFLRRTSLDELPQLFNVLKGEMSLVGPRPERPPLIEKFRKEIPRYMLRHKVKAGITGWAQVNGWRGDTSLEARIEHDIYYIENWSLWFDLKVLGLSLIRGFVNRNAY